MPPTSEPLIVIGVCLTSNDSTASVLVVQRRRAEGELSWQFPGGGVEEGENEEAAVKREILEETGIIAESSERLGERIHPATGRRIAYWHMRYAAGEPVLGDLDDLRAVQWIPVGDVAGLFNTEVFPPVAKVLARCMADPT